MPAIIMHINFCEQGQSIREACLRAVDWGFDGIEFRRKPHGRQVSPEEYLDEIAAGMEESGLRTVMFGVGARLLVPEAEARAAEVTAVEQFLRLAKERFQLDLANTAIQGPLVKGSATATNEHFAWCADAYRSIAAVAAELQIRLAFEIHMGLIHDLPAPTIKLLQMIDHPAVGANLDYGNIVYLPGAPSVEAAIAELGERIYYVHLKNSVGIPGGHRIKVGLGEGDINNRAFLKALQANGYSGPLCIEEPRPGDREHYAKQDISYLRSLLADLHWN